MQAQRGRFDLAEEVDDRPLMDDGGDDGYAPDVFDDGDHGDDGLPLFDDDPAMY